MCGTPGRRRAGYAGIQSFNSGVEDLGIFKFIHLSDLHILADSKTIHGVDTYARLEAAVDSIVNNFADAEFCMVTGDLADRGEADAYRRVGEVLDRLPFPWHPLVGNHDDRAVARNIFGALPWHDDGFLQYEIETPAGSFLVLDSVDGTDAGRLCERRLAWLQTRLDAARDAGKNVYLFMHHVPFDIGIGWLDEINMVDGDAMAAILAGYDNVKHLFMGHVHRPCHGSWHGIPFSTIRGNAHQAALRLGETSHLFIAENPSYDIVLIENNHVVIHDHSFLEERHPITR